MNSHDKSHIDETNNRLYITVVLNTHCNIQAKLPICMFCYSDTNFIQQIQWYCHQD